MDCDETFLNERYGKENHFHVPEGYFDDMASRMMSKLPNEMPTMTVVSTHHRSMRLWLGVAACLCGAVFGATVFFTYLSNDDEKATALPTTAETVQQPLTDSYMDDMADYTMMDNADIYAYLCNE